MSRSGASGYKVYKGSMTSNSLGTVIKGPKKEILDPLLDALNIQVDNPIVIMDQEQSKSFIKGKPEGMYKVRGWMDG